MVGLWEIETDYEQQVRLLTNGALSEAAEDRSGVIRALHGFCRAADIDPDIKASMETAITDGAPLLKTVWAETGGCPSSLFAFLPGCQHCLTQAKSAYGLGAESDWFAEQLGLMTNPMIPTSPEQIIPDTLPEFAKLQAKARRLAS